MATNLIQVWIESLYSSRMKTLFSFAKYWSFESGFTAAPDFSSIFPCFEILLSKLCNVCHRHVGIFTMNPTTSLYIPEPQKTPHIYSLQWRHKSPAPPLFTQPFIQAQFKGNIKAPRHWPLCGEFTGNRWIPCTYASNAVNVSIWWRHHVLIVPIENVCCGHLGEIVRVIKTLLCNRFVATHHEQWINMIKFFWAKTLAHTYRYLTKSEKHDKLRNMDILYRVRLFHLFLL